MAFKMNNPLKHMGYEVNRKKGKVVSEVEKPHGDFKTDTEHEEYHDTYPSKPFTDAEGKPFKQTFSSAFKSKSPVLRKDLQNGILGEANNDGTIFISKNIKEGSPLEAEVVGHEQKHLDDMKAMVKKPGKKRKVKKLGYGDDFVIWKGNRLKREDGKIEDPKTGEMKPEGDKSFQWEKDAYAAGKKARKKIENKKL
tara:strand:+ start:693 stop:1280 length:588 start_codon:yes stop_codon:yes gene_type:complete